VHDCVDKRISENKLNNVHRDDLLDLLIRDETFEGNREVIVDELLTIFFAGS